MRQTLEAKSSVPSPESDIGVLSMAVLVALTRAGNNGPANWGTSLGDLCRLTGMNEQSLIPALRSLASRDLISHGRRQEGTAGICTDRYKLEKTLEFQASWDDGKPAESAP